MRALLPAEVQREPPQEQIFVIAVLVRRVWVQAYPPVQPRGHTVTNTIRLAVGVKSKRGFAKGSFRLIGMEWMQAAIGSIE